MEKREDIRVLAPSQLDSVTGGAAGKAVALGVYIPGGLYKDRSMEFFRKCVGDETYDRAMSSGPGKRHHYVAARVFLKQLEWEQFCWIEQHGSLDGFPGYH